MVAITTYELPSWEWGTGLLEPGRSAELTRLALACNDTALLAAEAFLTHDRSYEMLEREEDGPLAPAANAWSGLASRYVDAMAVAYTGLAARFAAEMAITASALLTGEAGHRVAVPAPSAILADTGRWIPLVTIRADLLSAGPSSTDDWAEERAEEHAAERGEVHRALKGFLFDGTLAALDDPVALVDGAETSMIPAQALGSALHRYAAGLHWTCAGLTRTSRQS